MNQLFPHLLQLGFATTAYNVDGFIVVKWTNRKPVKNGVGWLLFFSAVQRWR